MIVLDREEFLVLDLDDTLYPERAYVRSGLRAVDGWVQRRWGTKGFLRTAWRSFCAGDRGTLFDVGLTALGVDFSAADIGAMIVAYREHEPTIRLYADAARLLTRAPSPAKLALITDGAAVSQRRKIAALGLAELIETIIVTDEIGRHAWKPSPVPFEQVAYATGARPGQLIYVGDNVRKDFVAPNALGWRTVRVVRASGVHLEHDAPTREHGAQVTVGSLDRIRW